jgi:hypothetical protein
MGLSDKGDAPPKKSMPTPEVKREEKSKPTGLGVPAAPKQPPVPAAVQQAGGGVAPKQQQVKTVKGEKAVSKKIGEEKVGGDTVRVITDDGTKAGKGRIDPVDRRSDKTVALADVESQEILELAACLNLPDRCVLRCMNGKAAQHCAKLVSLAAIKELDRMTGARLLQQEAANWGKTWNWRLGQMTRAEKTVKAPRLEEITGQSSFRVDCDYVLGSLDNCTEGPYAIKAAVAFDAEGSVFDQGFARMMRRDKDGIYSYFYQALRRLGSTYISWLKETLCHALAFRVVRRRYLTGGARACVVVLEDKRREDPEIGDQDESDDYIRRLSQLRLPVSRTRRGIPELPELTAEQQEALDGLGAGVELDAVPQDVRVEVERFVELRERREVIMAARRRYTQIGWGLLRDEEMGANQLGGADAWCDIVWRDTILDSVHDGDLDDGLNVFVSRARSAVELGEDLLAAWAGLQDEVHCYSGLVRVVAVHIEARHGLKFLKQAFGLHGSCGSLAYAALLVENSIGARDKLGFATTEGDLFRVRDILAHTFGVWEPVEGELLKITEFEEAGDGSTRLEVPFADWRVKVGAALGIVAPRFEKMVTLPGRYELFALSEERLTQLMAFDDYVTQMICGSGKNLHYFEGLETVELAYLVVRNLYATLGFYQDGKYHVSGLVWRSVSGREDDGGSGDGASSGSEEDDIWYIQTRASWEQVPRRCREPLVVFDVKDLEPTRFRSLGKRVYGLEAGEWDNLVSRVGADDQLVYELRDFDGDILDLRVDFQGHRPKPGVLFWHNPLDQVVGEGLKVDKVQKVLARSFTVWSAGLAPRTVGKYGGLADF